MRKNILVIYSSQNVKKRYDATGAFIPEAKAFAEYHKVPDENVIGIDCVCTKQTERRKQVLRAIDCCHKRTGKKIVFKIQRRIE